MQRIRSFISLLLLAVMLFPLLEKVLHQFEHAQENHCEKKELHFCADEHSCKICDYVFSSIDEPLVCHYEIKTKTHVVASDFFNLTSIASSFPNLNFSLRAPPIC